MPELPEVETLRRGLAARITGMRITAVEVLDRKIFDGPGDAIKQDVVDHQKPCRPYTTTVDVTEAVPLALNETFSFQLFEDIVLLSATAGAVIGKVTAIDIEALVLDDLSELDDLSAPRIYLDILTAPGDSGTPIVNSRGMVIGMIFTRAYIDSHFSYVTAISSPPIARVIKQYERNRGED